MAEYRVLREIAWRELVPWLILTRVFRVAVRPGALLLALAATLLMPLGWQLLAFLFTVPRPELRAFEHPHTMNATAAANLVGQQKPASSKDVVGFVWNIGSILFEKCV